MRVRSVVAAVAVSLGAAMLIVQPAAGAPPGADTVGGALAASIGFAQTIDTTQATTDADDAQLNVSCGAPATDASISYTITVAEDTTVIVDVSTSSYSAGVLVGVGAPGALELAACGPGTVGFTASAGLTYYVLAIDDQADGGGNGGTLNISFNETPPPPSIDVTVAPRGTFNGKTGGATLHGAYSCTDADFAFIDGTVIQQVGRVSTIQGSFEVVVAGACDGASHPWTADVVPSNGKFKGGQSLTVAFTLACGLFGAPQASPSNPSSSAAAPNDGKRMRCQLPTGSRVLRTAGSSQCRWRLR